MTTTSGSICGICYDDRPTRPTACDEKPETLLGQPIGQYHCPDCGMMVMAGMAHPEVCDACAVEIGCAR